MQKLTYAVGGLIAVFIIVGLILPRHARVEVAARIDAPPATVFALVNDFRRQAVWSPLTESDPNARVVYSGPRRGVGAAMTWDGAIIGTGTQIITESRPFEFVATTINPDEPGEALSWFDLARAASATDLTWGFEVDYGFNIVGRYFAPLLEGAVRQDYEKGLASLQAYAETLPATDFSELDIAEIYVDASEIAYLPTSSVPEPAAISHAMGRAYFEILGFIDENGLAEAGPPLSITGSFSGAELQFDAAIPVRGVTALTPRDGPGVRLGKTFAGSVLRVRHRGPYKTLGDTHRKIAAYVAALGIERAGNAWESYVSDPTKVPERELLTYIYYPIEPDNGR